MLCAFNQLRMLVRAEGEEPGSRLGVIYAHVCPTYIIVATSQFIENSCRYRGAMAIFENKRLTIIHMVSL